MTRPLRVFLCHASQDKPAVREMYQRLKTENWIDPWLDEEKLSLGQHWTTVIEDALHDADVVIIFLSKNSVQKEGFVQRELNYAWEISLEKPREAIFLIPFRLDDCQIPRYLSARQWGDYFGDKKENTYQVLLRSLKQRHLQKLQLEAIETAEREKTEKEAKAKAERVANVKAKLIAEQKAQQEGLESTEKIARTQLERELKERKDRELREKQSEELEKKKETSKSTSSFLNIRSFFIGGVIFWGLLCFVLATNYLIQNFPTRSTPTSQIQTPTSTFNVLQSNFVTALFEPLETLTPTSTFTPAFGVGSTMVGEDGMTLVYVPAGEFMMGSDSYSDEQPIHQVTLDAFWIDQTEVTNAMYARCVANNQCDSPSNASSVTRADYFGNSEFADYPVLFVSWDDAVDYCSYVGRRLPTEAEWEKAAHGTDNRIYPWGNAITNCSFANHSYFTDSFQGCVGDTTKVGSYPQGASIYGVLDMAGNVWEWVSSLYKSYPYSATDGRENLSGTGLRVMRGGSFNFSSNDIRTTIRVTYDFGYDAQLGFRCAKTP